MPIWHSSSALPPLRWFAAKRFATVIPALFFFLMTSSKDYFQEKSTASIAFNDSFGFNNCCDLFYRYCPFWHAICKSTYRFIAFTVAGTDDHLFFASVLQRKSLAGSLKSWWKRWTKLATKSDCRAHGSRANPFQAANEFQVCLQVCWWWAGQALLNLFKSISSLLTSWCGGVPTIYYPPASYHFRLFMGKTYCGISRALPESC